MPKAKITKSFVDSVPLSAKGQTAYCDSELRGFYLIVGTESKTYVAQKDIQGRSIRCTIGRHGHFTPEHASQYMSVMRSFRASVAFLLLI